MVVNFRTRGISQGTHKLTRTPTLKKKYLEIVWHQFNRVFKNLKFFYYQIKLLFLVFLLFWYASSKINKKYYLNIFFNKKKHAETQYLPPSKYNNLDSFFFLIIV
jgi:hypothetical protein